MNAAEKERFVRELVANVEASVLAKIPAMPDTWDGHELRQYLADNFADACMKLTRTRMREYRNTVLVANL